VTTWPAPTRGDVSEVRDIRSRLQARPATGDGRTDVPRMPASAPASALYSNGAQQLTGRRVTHLAVRMPLKSSQAPVRGADESGGGKHEVCPLKTVLVLYQTHAVTVDCAGASHPFFCGDVGDARPLTRFACHMNRPSDETFGARSA